MNFADTPATLQLDELYVGAYVMLDGGWLSHPFPVNSFKITTEQQLATLRGLKVQRVRWAPERSDPRPGAAAAALAGGSPAGGDAQAQAQAARVAAAAAHRTAWLAERESLKRCERRFGEATEGCKRVAQLAPTQPARAGELSLELTRALVGDLMSAGDVSVRLLTETSGDKSSMHAVNVAVVALTMGRTLGMSDADLVDLGQGALLHDLGKLELPDRVRHRDEAFSAAELNFYQEHVAHGVAHARRMGVTAGAQAVIAQHHEHADGSGFPARLGTDRTTLAARIVALIDRYDNLVNPPIPSKAITPHEALSLLFAQGKQGPGPRRFDTSILGAFIKMMGVYPPGSVVQLTDDRYALVVSMNSTRPLKPRVLVHDPAVRRDDALILDLETVPRLGVRRSVKPAQLPREAQDDLAPRQRVAYFFEPSVTGPGTLQAG
jgi:putative nucleotidyltransferase with HDIG domain